MLTNIQIANLYKLSLTPEFGLIAFKQPRQYLLVQRNIKRCKDLYDSLAETEKKVLQPSPEYAEFDSVRVASISPYLQKDAKGIVIQDEFGNVKTIEGQEEAAETVFQNLVDTYRSAIEEHEAKKRDWSLFLNSESDVEIDLIPFDDVILPEGFNNNKFAILSLMMDLSEVE